MVDVAGVAGGLHRRISGRGAAADPATAPLVGDARGARARHVADHRRGRVLRRASGAYAFYYLWVALFAAYFFSRAGTVAQTGFVAFAYAAVILANGSTDEWGFGWLLTIGAL